MKEKTTYEALGLSEKEFDARLLQIVDDVVEMFGSSDLKTEFAERAVAYFNKLDIVDKTIFMVHFGNVYNIAKTSFFSGAYTCGDKPISL